MVREGMARRRPSEDLRMAASKRYREADYEAAAALAREAIHLRAQLDGLDPLQARTTARVVLGASLVELGRYEEAVPWLEAARKETAMDGLLENLAVAYARTGRVAEARTLAEPWGRAMLASVGLPPSALPDLHAASGVEAVALLARGGDRASMNRAAGDKDVLDADRLAPNSALCRYLAARVLKKARDYDAAIARFESLLGLGDARFRAKVSELLDRSKMGKRMREKRALRAGS